MAVLQLALAALDKLGAARSAAQSCAEQEFAAEWVLKPRAVEPESVHLATGPVLLAARCWQPSVKKCELPEALQARRSRAAQPVRA